MAKIHPSITVDRITDACERHTFGLDDPGFCLECGYEQQGCEPDMRKGECEACGARRVYGAEELLFHMVA